MGHRERKGDEIKDSFNSNQKLERIEIIMSGFDDKVAYVPQDDVFFNDGREIALLHFIYSKPNLDEIRGNPAAVLAAIDEFGRTKNFLMNVGKFKGKIVSDLIAETKPKVMVRLFFVFKKRKTKDVMNSTESIADVGIKPDI